MRLLIILYLFIPPLLFASPAEEPEERTIPLFDKAQDLFGTRVNAVANRIDLFFADQRADDELARSRIRVRQSYSVRERALADSDTQFRFNLKLPSLEEKFKVEFLPLRKDKKEEKEKKEKKEEDAAEVTLQEKTEEQIKLERKHRLDKDWQFRADMGVNASIPPRIFARGRIRKNWTTGDLIHRFVEEVSWFSDRDWEENTNFNTDYSFDDETLLRFRNDTDWKITRKNYRTGHGFSLLQQLTEDEGVSYNVGLSTVVERGVWYVNNYRLSTTWRRNLYQQWIYLDLTPGIDFPKNWSFRRTPFIFAQIEALFGDE
jgi:hypothetical protein